MEEQSELLRYAESILQKLQTEDQREKFKKFLFFIIESTNRQEMKTAEMREEQFLALVSNVINMLSPSIPVTRIDVYCEIISMLYILYYPTFQGQYRQLRKLEIEKTYMPPQPPAVIR